MTAAHTPNQPQPTSTNPNPTPTSTQPQHLYASIKCWGLTFEGDQGKK